MIAELNLTQTVWDHPGTPPTQTLPMSQEGAAHPERIPDPGKTPSYCVSLLISGWDDDLTYILWFEIWSISVFFVIPDVRACQSIIVRPCLHRATDIRQVKTRTFWAPTLHSVSRGSNSSPRPRASNNCTSRYCRLWELSQGQEMTSFRSLQSPSLKKFSESLSKKNLFKFWKWRSGIVRSSDVISALKFTLSM